MPFDGTYSEVFSSEDVRFGGSGSSNGDNIKSKNIPMHGYDHSIEIELAPLSAIFLKCTRKKSKKIKPTVSKGKI